MTRTRPIQDIETVWIPMRDGIRLAARIWMPEDAEAQPTPATACRRMPLPRLMQECFSKARTFPWIVIAWDFRAWGGYKPPKDTNRGQNLGKGKLAGRPGRQWAKGRSAHGNSRQSRSGA